jgi:CRP-like cAMP-binding protein
MLDSDPMRNRRRVRTVDVMSAYTAALRKIPGLEQCRRRDLTALAASAERIDAKAGSVLFGPGDRGVGAFVVVEGEAVAQAHGWTIVLFAGSRVERTATMPADLTVRARTDVRVLMFARRHDLRMYSLSV